MDERETLIKVEQQLKDSIRNQSLILSDLKEIFNKIENESKSIVLLKSDFKSHLENTKIRRYESERRLKDLEEKQKDLIKDLNLLKKEIEQSIDAIEKTFKIDKEKIFEDINDSKAFKEQVTVSIKALKWFIGILLFLISVSWPIIAFILSRFF